MSGIPEKLPVKGPNDLFIPTKPEVLHGQTVDVPPMPDFTPVITWAELIKAGINVYLRNYVKEAVTGQIIAVKTRFWFGFAAGIMASLVVAFLVWQITRIF